MKALKKICGALFLLLFTLSTGAAFTSPETSSNTETTPPRWEKLGQRKVNYGVDRDEILVTASEGRFTSLKFKIKKSGINMHKCVVHFGDGTRQQVKLRKKIPAGGESRVIDIRGGKRVIKKVVFWYDTKNIANRRGVLELWGRH